MYTIQISENTLEFVTSEEVSASRCASLHIADECFHEGSLLAKMMGETIMKCATKPLEVACHIARGRQFLESEAFKEEGGAQHVKRSIHPLVCEDFTPESVLQVQEALNGHKDDGLSMGQLVEKTGLEQRTAGLIITELQSRGIVRTMKLRWYPAR